MLAKVIAYRGAAPADPGFAARIGYVCAKARQIELRHLAGGWIHAADQMRCIAGLNPASAVPAGISRSAGRRWNGPRIQR